MEDQSYVTDGNAVRVRVWGKADEYLCKCTSLSLSFKEHWGAVHGAVGSLTSHSGDLGMVSVVAVRRHHAR